MVASFTANSQCSDAEKKKLEEFDRTWGEAAERGDRAYLENVLADDGVNMGAGGIRTKKEVLEGLMAQAERRRKNPAAAGKTVADHYFISCTENTATITHRNTSTAMVDGKEEMEYSRSVHFLERRGGQWKVVSNVSNALDDYQFLLYMEQDWNDADLRRDVKWFERNFASDYSSVSSRTGAISNKAEDIADVTTSKRQVEALDLSDMRVRVEGNAAIVTGINRVRGKDAAGKSFDMRIRFTDSYIKRDGRWMVWATQGTQIPDKQ